MSRRTWNPLRTCDRETSERTATASLGAAFPTLVDRRTTLKIVGAAALGTPLFDVFAADPVPATDLPPPKNRFGRMVHEYFVREVGRAYQQNVDNYEQLQTREDAQRYVASVRARIRECFGPEPERTPLNPRVTGIVDRDAYRIEKVIFESRPSFPVTANLYLPKEGTLPRPGVIGTCGHSHNGKAMAAYQAFAQGLARLGYVCLIYDPIGQGERLQYAREDLTSRIGAGVAEHLYAGNQQFLVGEFFGMWRAWDGLRALDYLLTRPEVDPRHVGVTGNSGGGTLTTWLCGLDRRWTMAAPACFVTTFRHNMENELPADTEQCPPRVLALHLDHVDFLAAMAPHPVAILAQERDFFDVRGSHDAAQRLKTLYRLLGQAENATLVVGPNPHGYSQENREAMYTWFGQATGSPHDRQEPTLTLEEDQTLWCTPRGQVAPLDSTRTVFHCTQEKSRQLAAQRGPLRGEALQHAVKNVLKLPPQTLADPRPAPAYRILRSTRESRYPLPFACTYAVQSEPGIFALVYWLTKESWESRPPRRGSRAILYIAHRSSDLELQEEPLIREVMQREPESPLFTCDVRGIGESQPTTCGTNTFDDPYGCDYFYAIHSLMLDRPYLGQKTSDVLSVLDWLAEHGYSDIHLVARGWGALAGAFAALLSSRVTQVTLKNALRSYAEVAESESYRWPLATLLPNVLADFDLPDCYAELQAKRLSQIEPWGALAE
ncbi:MAG: alpha/beta hydrolase family protein [Pirellulaceae bacterium]